MTTVTVLECGCAPGYSLCPEAERLWADVGRAYDRRDFNQYDRALTIYNEHVGIEP